MAKVSIRELRNHGGAVLDQVGQGEIMTITRDGAEVAELRPLPRRSPSARELIARRSTLPAVDPIRLREDLDELLDPSL